MRLIQFTSDKITEASNGPFHFVNDGKPIQVEANIEADLLAMNAMVGGEMVPVFEKAVPKPKVEVSDDAKPVKANQKGAK